MSVYLFLKPIYLIQDHLMFLFSVEMPNSYVNPVKLLNAMITCGKELIGYAHAVQLFFFFKIGSKSLKLFKICLLPRAQFFTLIQR